jgi:hypothetical protein
LERLQESQGGSREVVRTSLTCVTLCSDRSVECVCTSQAVSAVGIGWGDLVDCHDCHDCESLLKIKLDIWRWDSEAPNRVGGMRSIRGSDQSQAYRLVALEKELDFY